MACLIFMFGVLGTEPNKHSSTELDPSSFFNFEIGLTNLDKLALTLVAQADLKFVIPQPQPYELLGITDLYHQTGL